MKDLIVALMAIIMGVAAVLAIAMIIGAIVALPVMWTWDYVMPDVFGLPELTFWQALWGTVMVKMLFPSAAVTTK